VIVTLADVVTVQVWPEVDVQPDQELKLLPPDVPGALKIIGADPELCVVNKVVPVVTNAVTELP
jgi:hypothetical protein